MSATKPFLLGLTGSIGMGKSKTASMFAELGVPVWDADECVHRLYEAGGEAVNVVQQLCPAAVSEGAVDRKALRAWIAADQNALKAIEAAVHPLVAQDRAKFISAANDPILVFDIPLLYETAADEWLDAVAVVSVDEATQAERVLARRGMSKEQFQLIQSKQLPDQEKRLRADFLIPTDTLEIARQAVEDILQTIRDDLNA